MVVLLINFAIWVANFNLEYILGVASAQSWFSAMENNL